MEKPKPVSESAYIGLSKGTKKSRWSSHYMAKICIQTVVPFSLAHPVFRVISFPPIFTLSFSICLMLVFNFWFALLLRQKNFLYKSERDCCEELLIETETNRMFKDWFRIPSEKLLLQLLLVWACCEV